VRRLLIPLSSFFYKYLTMPKFQINNIEIYYEMAGEGTPLLLIHGLGSCSQDWQLQVPLFSQHYRTITPDLRGHGQSDKPLQRYNVDMVTSDIIGLVKSLGCFPAHVVGLSLGGIIAFQLAIDEPELVRSLVVVNSYPDAVLRTLRHKLWYWQRSLIARMLGMKRLAQIRGRILFPKPEQQLLREAAVERIGSNDKKAYMNAIRSIIGWSAMDKLHTITCPTLVISGDGDYIPVSLKKEYVAKLPHAELVVIDDSLHATPIDQPEQFNKVLLEFLARQS
jgi:3-oxoadipate enol-lactonase